MAQGPAHGTSGTKVGACALALGFLAGGCSSPPTQEIAAAERQLEQAKKLGADVFAADRYREGRAALERARQEVQARDYRGALSAATDAAERARAAVQATNAARSLARGSLNVAEAEIRTMVDRAAEARRAAVAAGVPEPSLFALDEQLAAVKAGLGALSARGEDADLIVAQGQANGLRNQVTPLPDLYADAQQKRLAAPRAKARPRAASRRR